MSVRADNSRLRRSHECVANVSTNSLWRVGPLSDLARFFYADPPASARWY
jgi:hypothetical protein